MEGTAFLTRPAGRESEQAAECAHYVTRVMHCDEMEARTLQFRYNATVAPRPALPCLCFRDFRAAPMADVIYIGEAV